MDSSLMHHVALVLLVLWLLNHFNRCNSFAYFASLIYLFLVHERCVMRLRMKVRFEESKQSSQRRVLCDSESVRWLNHAVEKIWPICMEQIASQKIMLPIIPWFLEKYKPWAATKAVVQHLYLGRNPPLFTDMRVLRHTADDDHLVLELGMNFLTADDMSAILAVKLRKRLGFGMWAKLHITGMHVEGKLLIGVKFIRQWPFLGRLRVCFAEPPYFQMTVKPIFSHGLDVTVLPGIAGWLEKLLSIAFEQTLVEPNMLVVDVEKFASPDPENWFSIDEKEPVGYAKVEVVEASDMKPSDLNGLADPYVKGQLGPYRFRTKTQKKTLTPKWHEEFKIPICTWESSNVLAIEVRDKDHFVDDTLGDCTLHVKDLRDGQRHDMWLPLQNIKMGRLHLAITVLENNIKENTACNDEAVLNPFANENGKDSFSSVDPDESQKVPDYFEPINIEGQRSTGLWIHQPGSEISQIWEPRKGKARSIETQIHSVPNSKMGSPKSIASGNNHSSTDDENVEKHPVNRVQRGLRKIGSVFQRSPRTDDASGSLREAIQSPPANIKSTNQREISVKFVVEDDLSGPLSGKLSDSPSPQGSGPESPGKNVKDMAKGILKHAEKSARGFKHVLSRKRSKKSRNAIPEPEIFEDDSDSSDDEDLSSPGVEKASVVSNPMPASSGTDNSGNTKEQAVQTSSNNQVDQAHKGLPPVEETIVGSPKEKAKDVISSPKTLGTGVIDLLEPKVS